MGELKCNLRINKLHAPKPAIIQFRKRIYRVRQSTVFRAATVRGGYRGQRGPARRPFVPRGQDEFHCGGRKRQRTLMNGLFFFFLNNTFYAATPPNRLTFVSSQPRLHSDVHRVLRHQCPYDHVSSGHTNVLFLFPVMWSLTFLTVLTVFFPILGAM